ncbi:hypothetical protein Ancab_004394, partial [Ancistrocladus abbreviatus]
MSCAASIRILNNVAPDALVISLDASVLVKTPISTTTPIVAAPVGVASASETATGANANYH